MKRIFSSLSMTALGAIVVVIILTAQVPKPGASSPSSALGNPTTTNVSSNLLMTADGQIVDTKTGVSSPAAEVILNGRQVIRKIRRRVDSTQAELQVLDYELGILLPQAKAKVLKLRAINDKLDKLIVSALKGQKAAEIKRTDRQATIIALMPTGQGYQETFLNSFIPNTSIAMSRDYRDDNSLRVLTGSRVVELTDGSRLILPAQDSSKSYKLRVKLTRRN